MASNLMLVWFLCCYAFSQFAAKSIFFDPESSTEHQTLSTGSVSHVAICVCGQIGRMQPQFLTKHLLRAPQNRDFAFDLFFHLQQSSDSSKRTWFSTDADVHFGESLLAVLNATSLRKALETVYAGPRVTVRSMETREGLSRREWSKRLGVKKLDRIHDKYYIQIQDKILNMYLLQENCAHAVLASVRAGRRYDYFISTREDVFIFQNMDLSALTRKIDDGCGAISKNCLRWWGINMRMQLFNFTSGQAFLGRRLEYYKQLYDEPIKDGRSWYNPEIFESSQLTWMGLRHCPTPVTLMPVCSSC
jgi:hypothetical protein